MNLYVSNLSPTTTEDDLRQAFQVHGEVSSVSVLADQMKGGRHIGHSRGFGFVIMPDTAQAKKALAALNLHTLHGHALSVQKTRLRGSLSHRR